MWYYKGQSKETLANVNAFRIRLANFYGIRKIRLMQTSLSKNPSFNLTLG
jgi:hypothetical protein